MHTQTHSHAHTHTHTLFSRKERYNDLVGKSKRIFHLASIKPELFLFVDNALQGLLADVEAKIRTGTPSSSGMALPAVVHISIGLCGWIGVHVHAPDYVFCQVEHSI